MDNQNSVFNILATALVAWAVSNLNANLWAAVVIGLAGCGLFILKEVMKAKGYVNFGKAK
jgi:hypothetical protein